MSRNNVPDWNVLTPWMHLQDPGKQDDLAGRIMGACSLLLQADPNLKVAILGILPKGDVRKGQPSYELPNRWEPVCCTIFQALKQIGARAIGLCMTSRMKMDGLAIVLGICSKSSL